MLPSVINTPSNPESPEPEKDQLLLSIENEINALHLAAHMYVRICQANATEQPVRICNSLAN